MQTGARTGTATHFFGFVTNSLRTAPVFSARMDGPRGPRPAPKRRPHPDRGGEPHHETSPCSVAVDRAGGGHGRRGCRRGEAAREPDRLGRAVQERTGRSPADGHRAAVRCVSPGRLARAGPRDLLGRKRRQGRHAALAPRGRDACRPDHRGRLPGRTGRSTGDDLLCRRGDSAGLGQGRRAGTATGRSGLEPQLPAAPLRLFRPRGPLRRAGANAGARDRKGPLLRRHVANRSAPGHRGRQHGAKADAGDAACRGGRQAETGHDFDHVPGQGHGLGPPATGSTSPIPSGLCSGRRPCSRTSWSRSRVRRSNSSPGFPASSLPTSPRRCRWRRPGPASSSSSTSGSRPVMPA